MKQIYLLLLTILIFSFASAQQQIILINESFDNGTSSFNFNTGGVGTNSGNNQWIINSIYSGVPLYPNTPSQDSTVAGNISGAPFSNYLHIHDSTGGITNANWNTNTASDRFAFIGNSFCTLSMTDVLFTFYWTCEGNANAYGEVYYRINAGSWIQTGLPKYNNQSKWKYEFIQDPAFDNVQNLQFGFRWVNPGAGGTSNVSFGIDDIIAVGIYDNVNNPVTISVNSISSQTACQDSFLIIGYSQSAPLCDGTYQIQLSNSSGSFANPIDSAVFNLSAPDTTGFIGFQLPNNVVGNCFKVRINRISPTPQITGIASACFSIVDCPAPCIFTDTIHILVYDTTYTTVIDTTHLIVYDTSHVTVYDTIHIAIHDTTHVVVYDTTHVIVNDTAYISISVTDTLVITVTTGFAPPNNSNAITVYPNPAHDHLVINNGNLSAMTGYSIKITNTLGQVVFNQVVSQQQFYIDLNTFGGNGTYLLYVLDAQQTIKSIKEIVLQ